MRQLVQPAHSGRSPTQETLRRSFRIAAIRAQRSILGASSSVSGPSYR
jgi:hypothetical protein